MGIEENSGAAFSLIANDVADEAATHGIEAGRRFVEEDEFGLVDEGLGQTDALQHAFRKTTETPVALRGKSDEVEEGGNAVAELRLGESAESAMKREKLRGGQPVVEAEIFREEADLATNLDVRVGLIEDPGVAAAGFDKAEQHLDGGAFAGAIRAEEAEDFAAADLERKATNGDL